MRVFIEVVRKQIRRVFQINSDSAAPARILLAAVTVRKNPFRRRVPPCRLQGLAQASLLCRLQPYVRSTGPSPRAFHRHKHLRLRALKILLLVRHQLHHRPSRAWVTQRRKNLPADAKIRMLHVRALRSFRKTQRQSPKFCRRHSRTSRVLQTEPTLCPHQTQLTPKPVRLLACSTAERCKLLPPSKVLVAALIYPATVSLNRHS